MRKERRRTAMAVFDTLTTLLPLDTVVPLLAALATGGLIGLERTTHGRPAGFRTHALVCLAAALLMVVTHYQWDWLGTVPLETVRTDPTRIAQGIMTGIGFLGAGVIMRDGLSVRGLTTAASIWITAALGILAGIGLYAVVAAGTVITLLALSVFRMIESVFPTRFYVTLELVYRSDQPVPGEAAVRALLRINGFGVSSVGYSIDNATDQVIYRLGLYTKKQFDVQELGQALQGQGQLMRLNLANA